MSIRKPFAIASAVCLGAMAVAYVAMAQGDRSSATLVTDSGRHALSVELAQTPKDREVGLMNRETMDADHGMLFEFDQTRPVTMWMKNTLIPLDMLFLDEDGVVETVKTNAQPMSLDLIPSGVPVRYVLELNGGTAARYGVSKGDRVESEIIGD